MPSRMQPTSHHTEVCLSLKCVQHLDDVFVPQRPQNLNLLAQVFDVLLTLAMLVDEFHGSDLTGALSPALIHLHAHGNELDDACLWRSTRRAGAACTPCLVWLGDRNSSTDRTARQLSLPFQKSPLQRGL
eukprot:364434-Chlamydomonas_euryale.AAC.7